MILASDYLHDTPHELRIAENDLLKSTGGARVVWSGRAATALYLAFGIAGETQSSSAKPEVILPAICCATPANVAHLANFEPRFADVDLRTGLATLETIKARWSERTRAVVFVHLFGQTVDLTPLAAWCKSKKIVLIEDCAQALGGRLPDGQPVGSVGELSVFSFNPTKILECGGGALVIRDRVLLSGLTEELLLHALSASPDPELATQLAHSYRNLHWGLVGLLRLNPERRVSDLFLGLRGTYNPLFLRPFSEPEVLAKAWQEIPARLRHRYNNAEQYQQALAGGPWQLIDGWQSSGVCWRFSLLIDFPDHLVAFSEAVRRDGFHVSNLYWPLHHFFRPEDHCPNAVYFARRVVNLWVDQNANEKIVKECAASVYKHANTFSR